MSTTLKTGAPATTNQSNKMLILSELESWYFYELGIGVVGWYVDIQGPVERRGGQVWPKDGGFGLSGKEWMEVWIDVPVSRAPMVVDVHGRVLTAYLSRLSAVSFLSTRNILGGRYNEQKREIRRWYTKDGVAYTNEGKEW